MAAEDSAFAVLGMLGDPVRRRLYRHVAAAPGDVGRDAAAEAVGISRSLAAFHLDKLVEAGLLAVSFRRLFAAVVAVSRSTAASPANGPGSSKVVSVEQPSAAGTGRHRGVRGRGAAAVGGGRFNGSGR